MSTPYPSKWCYQLLTLTLALAYLSNCKTRSFDSGKLSHTSTASSEESSSRFKQLADALYVKRNSIDEMGKMLNEFQKNEARAW